MSSSGEQGNGGSGEPAISANGRFVAFSSYAANLAPRSRGTNVFVRDRRIGTTERVSPNRLDGGSHDPAISAHGRFVAFGSSHDAIYVRNRKTGKLTRVGPRGSLDPPFSISDHPSISTGGRFVAFETESANPGLCRPAYTTEVLVRDRRRGKTSCVSVSSQGAPANDWSFDPSISADGRFVAFESFASNLVAGDTNHRTDIFVRDRRTHTTHRVDVSSEGAQAEGPSDDNVGEYPSISPGGRFVAFSSAATNLVAGDTNGASDVFVRDRRTGTTRRVSVSSTGEQTPAPYCGDSFDPSISAGGRFVAFMSRAPNLVPGQADCAADVFVRDRRAGTTSQASVSSTGAQGGGGEGSYAPSISADGPFVAFSSYATNLVPGDTNQCLDEQTGEPYNCADVFVRGPLP